MAGSGVGGLVLANICQAIINTPSMGYRWALRVDGIICFVLLSLATVLVRPLGTASQTGGNQHGGKGLISWYLFKNPQFCVLFMVGLITTFGYMAPSMLLPCRSPMSHGNLTLTYYSLIPFSSCKKHATEPLGRRQSLSHHVGHQRLCTYRYWLYGGQAGSIQQSMHLCLLGWLILLNSVDQCA